jgi:hypothetical protein
VVPKHSRLAGFSPDQAMVLLLSFAGKKVNDLDLDLEWVL